MQSGDSQFDHKRKKSTDSPPLLVPNALTRRKFIRNVGVGAIGISGASLLLSQTGCGKPEAEADDTPEPRNDPPVVASDMVDISLRINQNSRSFKIDPRVTLLDLLREDAKLTGTKKGCDHGQCGACTVLVNGRTLNSCLALAVVYSGAEVTTIEGLETKRGLHPVQSAFLKHDAFQCGYCTPGQIMSGVALLKSGKARNRDEIREFMSGNLCRCGAYTNIVDAILEAQNPAPNAEGKP
jgi:xanthine dehydrogenase YagT iron-sulfur-binding subunit